jgi:regulator of protease activity HflC (stomatin/prohibitin superfamily)
MIEKNFKAMSGYIFLLLGLGLIIGGAMLIIGHHILLGVLCILIGFLMELGLFFNEPNESKILTLFGDYVGTSKDTGFMWANPFYAKKKISLRAKNFESERIKVNDKRGNPILISVITVWRVKDTFKAAFEIESYENFVKLQSDAAARNLAGSYAYDNMENDHEITLRSGLEEINKSLEDALAERLSMAGIEVLEARIGYLAYAEEIAGAMLKRQQAEAVVAARHKIVEGAVSMVEMALHDLSKKNIINLDEDKKASMVSNLMVILCSDKEATPVVNTGTLYQ